MTNSNQVTNQSHYTRSSIEPIEYIKAQGWFKNFAQGNIIKYVTRYPYKNGVEDLQKALVYLNWLIKYEKGEK